MAFWFQSLTRETPCCNLAGLVVVGWLVTTVAL